MKRFYGIAAILAGFVAGAAAQDNGALDKQKAELEQLITHAKVLATKGAVMGSAVKGAPYSATEVNESTQMLADGTRIHHESQVNVFRDSDGRTRRENPEGITIFDPVAGVSYSLDVKTQTARKLPGMNYVFVRNGNGEAITATYSMRVSGSSGEGPARAEAFAREADAAARAQIVTAAPGWISLDGPMAQTVEIRRKLERSPGQTESLGKQIIEGVNAEGTRTTQTLEAGAIGNDRPIQMVSERWYSPELQTVMMTRHSDPRTGDEVFKLTNVSRSEPSPVLFQVPAGYQVIEQK